MASSLNLPTQHWTVENVYYYVKNLEIDGFKYNENAEIFRKECINGKLFLNLEKEDLNVLGITNFTKRNVLYKHLQKLKATQIKQNSKFTSSPIRVSNNNNSINAEISLTPTINVPFIPLPPTQLSPNHNNNNNNSMGMTPLILPQSNPINNNNNNNKRAISDLINSLNTNSPIFGSQFPTIQTSPNLLPSLMNNTPIFNFKAPTTTRIVPMSNNNIRLIANNYHLVEIAGIYQGINSHGICFILMTQDSIIELNNLYTDKEMNRNIFSPLQKFKCSESSNILKTHKIQHGWLINNKLKLPFNPLIYFRLNILSNEIIGEIKPIIISGHINHINNYNQTWVSSDLQIDAIEEINSIPTILISNIISFKLTNISHTSLQQRDASYLHHDPENQHKYKLKKGLPVKFCLKLSTRTNKKNSNTRKPVFVQCWNLKPL
mmetsp:Transcript_67390/g.60534  ORF Transcript_67390/g.60534 Transcript_67390/m.60534 type:complete len:434 (+) Transcript_67390:20-1321(+)